MVRRVFTRFSVLTLIVIVCSPLLLLSGEPLAATHQVDVLDNSIIQTPPSPPPQVEPDPEKETSN